ncbi:unnamed protein product [Fraxinus pennsylvanica]|uniref:Integrase catalytic domain-containing protein n=1 Tax=Fraxinus pennsylvanica TaxID=56036 RepID=A0AAD2DLG6_9LAMI|nr:unnamed protein product [Fraxinus pennsylvanica]
MGRENAYFAIVVIDYFTKWVEAKPLAKITEVNTSKFLWKNIICRFGIPYFVVSDNGAWVDELPQVFWAIQTTYRTVTGETPFSMTYGAKVMSPAEVGVPSPRRIHFYEIINDELRKFELELLEEIRDDSQIRFSSYQRKMMRCYNAKVKKRAFRIGDLVLRRTFPSTKELGTGTLVPNWEGEHAHEGPSQQRIPTSLGEVRVPPSTKRTNSYHILTPCLVEHAHEGPPQQRIPTLLGEVRVSSLTKRTSNVFTFLLFAEVTDLQGITSPMVIIGFHLGHPFAQVVMLKRSVYTWTQFRSSICLSGYA